MRVNEKIKYIERAFPIFKIEQGFIISKDGDVTAAFEFSLPELFTFERKNYEHMHSILERACRMLPSYTIVHKQDWYFKEKYVKDDSADDLLSESYQQKFEGKEYLTHRSYLYITLSTKQRSQSSTRFSTLAKTMDVIRQINDQDRLSRFRDMIDQFTQIINDTGFMSLVKLSDKQIIDLSSRYININREDLSDITLSDDDGNIRVGTNYVSVHSISDIEQLPGAVFTDMRYDRYSTDITECNLSFTAPIGILMSHEHIVNQYMFIDSNEDVEGKLTQSIKNMNSLAKHSSKNAVNAKNNSEYLSTMNDQSLIACRCHVNIITFSECTEKLRMIRNDVSSAIATLGCLPYHNKVNAAPIWWAGIPGNAADIGYPETFLTFTQQALCFFVGETTSRSSLSATGIRLSDRLTGRPVIVDLWKEPFESSKISNWNKFILGSSGSGKSFTTNTMTRQFYEMGNHVLIIDVGDSYRALCRYIHEKTKGKDGIYYTYTPEQPLSFNPFYSDTNLYDEGKTLFLRGLIISLWKKPHETISRDTEIIVDELITQYLKRVVASEITPCFNTFYEFVQNIFSTDIKLKTSGFDLDSFLRCLQPYYIGGKYEYLLNSNDQLDLLGKRFIVFELDNIKDNEILFTAISCYIMSVFISKMQMIKHCRKMIIIEEAWKAISQSAMADFMKYLFKTARKHDAEACVVTQEIDDIVGNAIVKDTIINNSDTKIVLDMGKYLHKFDKIQELMGLTEKNKNQILSLNLSNDIKRGKYKEMWIGMNNFSAVYAVEVSQNEAYTYTTTASEKNMVQGVLKQHGYDYEKAYKHLKSQ